MLSAVLSSGEAAVNHLAPFLLTGSLLPALLAAAPGARIVNVSSNGHYWGPPDLDDLHSERAYSALKVYGKSKAANVMFTHGITRKLVGKDVTAKVLHPGPTSTRLGRGQGAGWDLIQRFVSLFLRSPDRGAETSPRHLTGARRAQRWLLRRQ